MSNRMTFRPIASLVAVSLTILQTTTAQAATLYDSAGFETRFTPFSALQNQDPTQGPWKITSNANPATATVRPTVGRSSSTGVEVQVSGSKTDTQWYVSKPASTLTNVNVNWDMQVAHTNVAGLQYGPFFGVEVYDASSSIKPIGGFGVDATTGDLLILVTTQTSTVYAPLATPRKVAFDSYNTFGLSVDFSTKRYSVLLNGLPVDSVDFVDPTASTFTDAPIATRFLSNLGEQSLNSGVADFDNYVITSVPEPTMISGVAAIFLGIAKRRR